MCCAATLAHARQRSRRRRRIRCRSSRPPPSPSVRGPRVPLAEIARPLLPVHPPSTLARAPPPQPRGCFRPFRSLSLPSYRPKLRASRREIHLSCLQRPCAFCCRDLHSPRRLGCRPAHRAPSSRSLPQTPKPPAARAANQTNVWRSMQPFRRQGSWRRGRRSLRLGRLCQRPSAPHSWAVVTARW